MQRLSLLAFVCLAGCDYSADFLFTGQIDGVDDVLMIEGPDGQYVVPAVINTYEDIAANAIFAEVSQSLTARLGGATLEFIGTGGPVCIWADPEVAFWSQAIEQDPSTFARQFTYPDNGFDDGDIDIAAGLSVFYTGSPGEQMGDFVVFYEDSLGNEVPISLVECLPKAPDNLAGSYVTSGRAAPENCTVAGTAEGVAYTVALTAWSVPLDDDRLSFGVLVAEGGCDRIFDLAKQHLNPNRTAADPQVQECVIMGESLIAKDAGPHYGLPTDLVWPGSEDFERAFCRADGAERLDLFCEAEADRKFEDGETCDWRAVVDDAGRCYCGDLNDTPDGGGL